MAADLASMSATNAEDPEEFRDCLSKGIAEATMLLEEVHVLSDHQCPTGVDHPADPGVSRDAQGYRFGDFTWGVLRRAASMISGEEKAEYKFGDVTKAVVAKITGKDHYEFGDITKTILLGRNHTYKFGDVTKALVKIAAEKITGEEQHDAGAAAKVVLAEAAKGKSEVIKDITGKEEYKFGDLTRAGIKEISGKEDYEFGDLTKAAATRVTGKKVTDLGEALQLLVFEAAKCVLGEDDKDKADVSTAASSTPASSTTSPRSSSSADKSN